MYAYVLLQDDNKFIKSVSDGEQQGAIKILVPLNWQRKFFEYPTKFWLDENKTLQGDPKSLPKDSLEDLEATVSTLKDKLNGVDLSQLTQNVNELQEAENKNDTTTINNKIKSLGTMIINAQNQLATLKQQANK